MKSNPLKKKKFIDRPYSVGEKVSNKKIWENTTKRNFKFFISQKERIGERNDEFLVSQINSKR